jgi:thiamine-phosphate pyrophosphorylase
MLIINDRVDIALSVDADGVHVGKSSLGIPIIKRLLSKANKDLLIGYSAHSLDESIMAERSGVDWVTFSPIYYTPSKIDYGKPQGIRQLIKLIDKLNIPIYALGGVNILNANEVCKTGVYGIALISNIISSKDPKDSAKEMIDIINN